jgi:hypothetical protein
MSLCTEDRLLCTAAHSKRSHIVRSDHDQQRCYHHAPTVKPEAATAVVELLMMGVETPETYWATHKRQVINLWKCCIWLVIYLNCMMMHGPAKVNPTYFSRRCNFVMYCSYNKYIQRLSIRWHHHHHHHHACNKNRYWCNALALYVLHEGHLKLSQLPHMPMQ